MCFCELVLFQTIIFGRIFLKPFWYIFFFFNTLLNKIWTQIFFFFFFVEQFNFYSVLRTQRIRYASSKSCINRWEMYLNLFWKLHSRNTFELLWLPETPKIFKYASANNVRYKWEQIFTERSNVLPHPSSTLSKLLETTLGC